MAKVFTITEGLENLGALKSGGQGSVYKAKRTGEIITAIKILPTPISSESEDDKNFISFQNEVQKLKKVNESPNPNVVTILTSGITDTGNLPYIEMEYIEGPDLGELLKPPHPPVFTIKEVIKVADHLSNALAHCHHANVKHGDIKSNNVKFNQHTGNYILLDFGLSVMSDEQRRTSIRHAGAIEFMAPEQNTGETLFQTDIYSFGVILFELLAGTVPFPLKDKGESARNAVMISHMEIPPPDLLSLRRLAMPDSWKDDKKEREMKVPGWLISMTYKCLEKKPENRFKNGRELQDYIHSGIFEEAVTRDSNVSGNVDLPVEPGNDTSKLQKQVKLLNQQVEAKESEINELQDQLTNKDKELYQFKYSDTPGHTSQKGVSRTAFLTVLIIAFGLAAFAAYHLFIKPSILSGQETTSVQATKDSLYSGDTITRYEDKLQKKQNNQVDSVKTLNVPSPVINTEELEDASDTVGDPSKIITRDDAGTNNPSGAGSKYRVITIAHFHDRPDENSKRNAFMTYQDRATLTALDEQNDFIYIIFTNTKGQTSKGWIRKKDLTLVNE